MREKENFLRTFFITLVVTFCICLGFIGICEAYEGVRKICFGEYRNAIEIEDGKFKFFDFTKEF